MVRPLVVAMVGCSALLGGVGMGIAAMAGDDHAPAGGGHHAKPAHGNADDPAHPDHAPEPAAPLTKRGPAKPPAAGGGSGMPLIHRPGGHQPAVSMAGDREGRPPVEKPRRPDASRATKIGTPEGEVGAAEALALLREGNERWVAGEAQGPATEPSRRRDLAEQGQKPWATVLTCADSRLPVERVFDRGVGELFVLRVAGNVVGDHEAGTIEYGAEHLHVPLLVVMGHSKCGAVAAAVGGGHVEGNVASLLDNIAPAVERARKQSPEAEGAALADLAVRENVWQGVFDLLRSSPAVRAMVREGKLTVVGAVCDVADGRVQWLGEHPWQAELVEAFDARAERTAGAGE